MSNQTEIILFQLDKFLNQTISEQAFANFVEAETHEKMVVSENNAETPFIEWMRHVISQLQADEEPPFFEQIINEFLLEQAEGLYHLADFRSGSFLNMDLTTLQPLLPERFQARIEYACSEAKNGSPIPSDATTELTLLSEMEPAWLFFTRQEIIDIRPIVLAVIEDETIDFYDDEWHQVITAHERHEYDWLAFKYMI